MSRYAWIITRDHIADVTIEAGTNSDAAGVTGPHNQVAELKSGEGKAFRMLDDDGNLYYTGRIIGNHSGFEPLEDFGTPNAGCTEIRYLNNHKWETL
jgi:hypothetical protein